MKKSLVVLSLVLVAVLAFFFKDSLFGTSDAKITIKGEEYTLAKTGAPNNSVLGQMPADTFFLAYQVGKSEILDTHMIKYVQYSLKSILESFEEDNSFAFLQNSELEQILKDFYEKDPENVQQNLKDMGLKFPLETYLYNVGLRPLVKISVDEAKITSYLDTKELNKKSLGDQTYYSYPSKDLILLISELLGKKITSGDMAEINQLPEIDFVISVKDGFLNLSIDNEFLIAENLKVALGFEQPQQKFDLAKFDADLTRHSIDKSTNVSWVDFKGLLTTLLDEDKELIAIIRAIEGGGLLFTQNDKTCLSEAVELIANVPLFVANSKIYTKDKKLAIETIGGLQIDAKNALADLKNIESSFTSLEADAGLAFGMGMNFGEVYNFIKNRITYFNERQWQCDDFSEIAFDLKNIMPKLNVLNMVSWLNGFSFSLTGASEEDLSFIISVDSNNYSAMSSYIDMVSGASGMGVLAENKNFSNLADGEDAKLNPILLEIEPEAGKYLQDHKIIKSGDSLMLKTSAYKDRSTNLQKGLFSLVLDTKVLKKIKQIIPSEEFSEAELAQLFDPNIDIFAEYHLRVTDQGLGIGSISAYEFIE